MITDANLRAEMMADRFLRHLDVMTELCQRRQGPFLYAVGDQRLTEIQLRE